MVSEDRLPFSFEAEQAVLGAVIIEPSILDEVLNPILKPEYFHIEQHRKIFELMQSMNLSSKPIDYVTLLEMVKENGIFTESEGKQYLLQLTELVPSVENVGNYARIIADKAILRQLINASDSIREKSIDAAGSPEDIVEFAEQRIYDIANKRVNTGFYNLKLGLQESMDRYMRLAADENNEFAGLPTYFGDLDRMMGGMHKGDLIIIAARPGIGKSSLALNIAENVAIKAKKKVAFFSLEMPREQLIDRVISSQALIDNSRLRTGELQPDDWRRIAEATAFLSDCEIYFDDTSMITVSQIKSKLRRLKNVDLVVIDYLQLLSSGIRSDSRVQEVSEMTRSLKIMAKEIGAPVIALSQLSRRTEDRSAKDHRPQLSDLRESGSIEQDADSVIFLYNDSKYSQDPDTQNVVEIILGKNRHGETGTIKVDWNGRYTKFSSIERRFDAPPN